MADHYGSAEVIAGTLAARRDDLQFLTKWVPEPGPASEEAVDEAVARALERLGTDCIDLLQFHAWSYADPSWLDCLFMLAEHQAAGRIRHLGLTNCDAVHLDMAVRSGVPIRLQPGLLLPAGPARGGGDDGGLPRSRDQAARVRGRWPAASSAIAGLGATSRPLMNR